MCFFKSSTFLRIGISLFVFIGVSLKISTVYADTYKNWSKIELSNMLLNSLVLKTSYDVDVAKEKLLLHDSEINTLLDYLNDYGYNYISWYNSGFSIHFQLFNTSNLYNVRPQLYRNCLTFNSSPSGITYNVGYNGDWYFQNIGNVNTATSFGHYSDIYYSGTNVYQGTNVIINGGYYIPNGLFDENYFSNVKFEIDINTNNNTDYIDINTEFGVTLEDIPIIYSSNFGYLYDTTYKVLINDNLQYWFYNGSTWVSNQIFNRADVSWVLLPSNNYLNVAYDSSNNNEIANLTLNNIIIFKNVVYEYTVNNVDGDTARGFFLIGDSNTIISGDTLDTSSNYWNGSYIEQFNNLNNIINDNNNTNEIIESIVSTENVDNVINDTFSGDTNFWANNFGMVEIGGLENPITSFLLDLVTNVYNALTVRQDIIIDLNHHNTTGWVINTRDFITPESDIKNLVKWCLVFIYLYGNYKYFHYLFSLLQTARIDKAIAELGTDEFYDTDIM